MNMSEFINKNYNNNQTTEETLKIEIPKRKCIPNVSEKNKRIEKRGRKAKPKEEDKIKRKYIKNFIKKVSIFKVEKRFLPEDPPFWFF